MCRLQAGAKSRKKLLEAAHPSNKEGDNAGDKEASVVDSAKLLPLFKAEMQNLDKRAKYAEASFMNLYRKLMEAPDPAPLLSAASSATSILAEGEAEIRRLKQELEVRHALLNSSRINSHI
eukprot:1189635-Prorocentrum_minimum.AAC.6